MNLTQLAKQLQNERDRARKEVERFEQALAALETASGKEIQVVSRGIRKARRKMSAAGRRKVAAAQKARWAAWRKAKTAKA